MLRKALVLSALLIGGVGNLTANEAFASPSDVNINVFHNELSPHGDWVMVAGWGEVWRPNVAIVGRDFVPYVTDGDWVASDYGWVFESRYQWGWAPFHYGRWVEDAQYGWVWVPDEEWGPAWVDWRTGGGYVGWAPLPPRGHRYHEPHWVFVETRHFVEPNVVRFVLPRPRVQVAFSVSAPVTHRVVIGGRGYVEGPPIRHVERVVGRPPRRVAVVPPRRTNGQVVIRRADAPRGTGIDLDRGRVRDRDRDRDDDDDNRDHRGHQRSRGRGHRASR